MKNNKLLIGNICLLLVKANIKLRYIKKIHISEMYDMYSNEISPLIIIEVLNRSYCVSGVLETALKSLDITIEITYLGEYTGSIRMPKNMWVKMTTAEQEAYMQRKDPCIGCELCEKNECSSTAVNAYLSTEGFGKRVSLQDCTCQSLTRIFPLSIEFL